MGCGGTIAWALALPLTLIFASAIHAQNPSEPPAAPLPPDAGPAVNDAGFYVFGEGLYVWPHRDNLQTATLSNGNTESLAWSGTPGFRVGVGCRLPDTSWDLEATFAYFHAASQRTVAAPDGGALSAALTTNPAAQNASDADGDSGLSYGVLDLDIGWSCHIDDSLALRLFSGVRVAMIDQSLKCIYSGGALGATTDFINAPVRFDGAGLTAGAEGIWDIDRGWGLFGKARLGLIAGRFSSLRTETLGAATTSNISDTLDTVVPLAEVSAGLHYQGERFFLSAGCELSNWFNMVDGLAAPNPAGQAARRQGSLTLEAVTLKVGFVF